MTITASTKTFEVIPYDDGQGNPVSQVLTIPASVVGTADDIVDNPQISVANGENKADRLTFDIRIKAMQGELLRDIWMLRQEFTYDEMFAILGPTDLSGFPISSPYVSGVDSLSRVMYCVESIYDKLLCEVPWLKDLIQEKV